MEGPQLPAGELACADQACLPRESGAAVGENVDQGQLELKIGRFERIIRSRKEVDLALRPADDPNGFPEVRLGMPGRVDQRHEYLLVALPPARNVILHNRYCAATITSANVDYDRPRFLPIKLRGLEGSQTETCVQLNPG